MLKIKDLYQKYIVDRKLKMVFYLAIAGISLLLIPSLFSSGGREAKTEVSQSVLFDTTQMKKNSERELKDLLEGIDGIIRARVMISYNDNGRMEYHSDERISIKGDSGNSAQGQDQDKKIVFKRNDGDEIPVVVRELYPEIKGVAVVVDSGNDPDLKYKIIRAAKASLGVETHKIEIIINEKKE